MLDLTNGNPGKVTQDGFLEFMQKYMLCRADLLQTKFKISESMMFEFIDNFTEIAGAKTSFTVHDFIAAKQKNPQILSCLEDFDMGNKQYNKVDYFQVKLYHEAAIHQLQKTREQLSTLTTTEESKRLIDEVTESIDSLNKQFCEFE